MRGGLRWGVDETGHPHIWVEKSMPPPDIAAIRSRHWQRWHRAFGSSVLWWTHRTAFSSLEPFSSPYGRGLSMLFLDCRTKPGAGVVHSRG